MIEENLITIRRIAGRLKASGKWGVASRKKGKWRVVNGEWEKAGI
jgi:hypothetical protein